MRVLVTGGAGFIGSALCRHLAADPRNHVVNLDKLTYAGNVQSLRSLKKAKNYVFCRADIANEAAVLRILTEHRIGAVMHLAAESHVDRSIDGPAAFIDTNVVGTFRLLNAVLGYWRSLPGARRDAFRFLHVSTDEVFGDLPLDSGVFTETSPYAPTSPYAASKASSDQLVRAWHATYGLPVLLSNCSNNYGPYHFPEKLVPLTILNAIHEKSLTVYGRGANIRDWLYVDDHARALETVLRKGVAGESYNIGGRAERRNLAVVEQICELLDARHPRASGRRYRNLIEFVEDRPGHDRRYAIDPSKIETRLGWRAQESFETGLAKTVDWYLDNDWWWRPLREKVYKGERLGYGWLRSLGAQPAAV